MNSAAETEAGKLPRVLSLRDGVAIVVGSVIGSGIFLVPSSIAANVPNSGLMLLVWVVAGLFALLGALSYAELGASYPNTGGQYVYLRQAYGPLISFIYGWTLFLVIQTGSTATVSVAFGIYLGYFLPMPVWGQKLAAVMCILFLTYVNYRGVRLSAAVQNMTTLLKSLAIILMVASGLVISKGSWENFKPLWPADFSGDLLSRFGAAMIGAFWAYEGWHYVTFTAGELKEPKRNVPASLILGTLIVISLYLGANLVYLYMLPVSNIASSDRVAADAMQAVLGATGGSLISAAILVSTFGAANGGIMTGPRVYFAMAQDDLFFKKAAQVHPVYKTPALSILVQGIWAAILTLTGTYSQLFTYVIFAAWIFYAMTVGAVFILRRKYPERDRPYKVWAYPIAPLLFIAFSAWFLANTLINDPRASLMGLIIILIGLPVYWYWRKNR